MFISKYFYVLVSRFQSPPFTYCYFCFEDAGLFFRKLGIKLFLVFFPFFFFADLDDYLLPPKFKLFLNSIGAGSSVANNGALSTLNDSCSPNLTFLSKLSLSAADDGML